MAISLEWGANDLHMVQLMPLPVCVNKIQNGLSFWYQLTQIVLDKGCKTVVVVMITVTVTILWCCRCDKALQKFTRFIICGEAASVLSNPSDCGLIYLSLILKADTHFTVSRRMEG